MLHRDGISLLFDRLRGMGVQSVVETCWVGDSLHVTG